METVAPLEVRRQSSRRRWLANSLPPERRRPHAQLRQLRNAHAARADACAPHIRRTSVSKSATWWCSSTASKVAKRTWPPRRARLRACIARRRFIRADAGQTRAPLPRQGLRLHAALPITLMLDTLVQHGKVSADVAVEVRKFIADNQTAVPSAAAAVTGTTPVASAPKRMTYGARAALAANAAGKRLLECMERKRTNLCVAADVPTCASVLALADAIGARVVACVRARKCRRLTAHPWRASLYPFTHRPAHLLPEDARRHSGRLHAVLWQCARSAGGQA